MHCIILQIKYFKIIVFVILFVEKANIMICCKLQKCFFCSYNDYLVMQTAVSF